MERYDLGCILKLKRVGFQTGSVKFGCDNPKDEDWVVKNSDWNKIVGSDLGKFYYNGREYSNSEFRNFKIKDENIIYNFIIPSTNDEYIVWKIATHWMSNIPAKYIQNKQIRVELFEQFKDLIRMQQ